METSKKNASNIAFRFLLPAFCFLLSAFCILPLSLFAQKSKPKTESKHNFAFNIKNCNDNQMLLAIHYKDKLMLKDSAFNNGKCAFIFEGTYDDGMYSLVSGKKRPMLNFIIDGAQKFTYNIDTTGNVNNFSIIGSPENAEMLRFQQKTTEAQKRRSDWIKKAKEFGDTSTTDSLEFYVEKMKNLHSEMEQFIAELIDKNPTFLFSKLQKSYRDIEIPDPPVYPDGSIDSLYQLIYYRTHYWDNFDLTDSRFLFLPSFDPKLNDYVKKILWHHEVDTINKYLDRMLDAVSSDSLMYRNLIHFLTYEFEQSKIIGHDAVFVHLAKNNQLKGKCPWIDEDLIKQYQMRVEDWEPTLIGKKSVEMILPDTAQSDNTHEWYSSYNMPKKYRILWFYDQTCHTCAKESKELKAVVDSLDLIGQLNFDVYAVNRTDDIDRWKKYIHDGEYTWINVGGTKGTVDWTKAYHINSYPQFYIIDQEKKIILNKNISKDKIPQFLQEYEQMEAEKARLKNRKQ
jgi:thioredoxin-related protein